MSAVSEGRRYRRQTGGSSPRWRGREVPRVVRSRGAEVTRIAPILTTRRSGQEGQRRPFGPPYAPGSTRAVSGAGPPRSAGRAATVAEPHKFTCGVRLTFHAVRSTRLPSRRRPSRSGRGSREIRPVASRPASRRRLLTMTVLPGPDAVSGRTCWASSASSSTAADASEAPGCAFVSDARDHRSMSGDDPLAPPGKGGRRSRSGSVAGDAVRSARPSGSSARRQRGRP